MNISFGLTLRCAGVIAFQTANKALRCLAPSSLKKNKKDNNKSEKKVRGHSVGFTLAPLKVPCAPKQFSGSFSSFNMY